MTANTSISPSMAAALRKKALQNRAKAYQWYVDQAVAMWENAGFEHLELTGFYYYEETIHESTDRIAKAATQELTKIIHSHATPSTNTKPAFDSRVGGHLYIYQLPFYQSEGYWNWSEYGFDYALMQPNYSFYDMYTLTQLKECADLCAYYGLGMQMEFGGTASTTYHQKFEDYLNYGKEYGYQSAVVSWYMSTWGCYSMAYNNNGTRYLYDMVYEFVQGQTIPTCRHPEHNTAGRCTTCAEDVGHTMEDGVCTGCGKECGHSYREEVITAPDCETDGVVVYTCSECGDSYTQTTTASGHSYADGKCTACGKADPNAITVPTLTAKNISLSFEDEILVNVYFIAADTADVENYGLLLFSEKVESPTFDTAIAYTEGWYESNGYLGVTTPGIAAKNMGDTLYFAVYAVLADGTYAYSKTYTYAPTTYAYNMLGKSTTPAGLKPLIVAMLNYGAAAQVYFNYNTDNLVNAKLTDEQKALVVDYNGDMLDGLNVCMDDKKGELFGSGNTGFDKNTPSVNFEGAFSVNFYFSQPKAAVGSDVTFYVWDKATYESVDTLLPENAVATSTCTFDGTYYAGIVEGIAAKQVDETFYCAAVFTGEDGNTYVSGVISYSLGYYLENQANGTKMPDFAKATGVYAYYAKTLFNA